MSNGFNRLLVHALASHPLPSGDYHHAGADRTGLAVFAHIGGDDKPPAFTPGAVAHELKFSVGFAGLGH